MEFPAIHWSFFQQYPAKIGEHDDLLNAILFKLQTHFLSIEQNECHGSLHSEVSLQENSNSSVRIIFINSINFTLPYQKNSYRNPA